MQPFDEGQGDHVLEFKSVQNYKGFDIVEVCGRPILGDANGTPGEFVSVRTDKGNRVLAWRPNPQIEGHPDKSYFCHGFSLGTFCFASTPNAGYSVMSGGDMIQVLKDEYEKIWDSRTGSVQTKTPQKNDLFIWCKKDEPVHSAVLINPVFDAEKGFDKKKTLVNSKTGTGALKQNVCLSVVYNDYSETDSVELYRRQA